MRTARREGSATSACSVLSVPTKVGDEAASPGGCRCRRGCRCCSIMPGIHDHDAVGDRQRLFLVVGDEDRGDAEFALDVADLRRAARRGSWRRAPRAARRAAACAGAARWRGPARRAAAGRRDSSNGKRLSRPDRPIELQHLVDARLDLLAWRAGDLQAEADIVGDIHVGEQRIGLEHHADLALVRPAAPVMSCPSTRMVPAVGRLEAGDHAQDRGLAAAGRAEQRDELALRSKRRSTPLTTVLLPKVLVMLLDARNCSVHGQSLRSAAVLGAKRASSWIMPMAPQVMTKEMIGERRRLVGPVGADASACRRRRPAG